MALEGGFSGRANKLVDGCYSFWQGGLLPLLTPGLGERTHVHLAAEDLVELKEGGGGNGTLNNYCFFDPEALQRYILAACQVLS
jgi:protein farnesyltransferase subunit beta